MNVCPRRLPLALLSAFLWFSLHEHRAPLAAESTTWAIVQPGYPGGTADRGAVAFMERFSKYLETKASFSGLSGKYYNEPVAARAHVREASPAFAVVSLGFYLAERRRLGLQAVLAVEPREQLVIARVPGGPKDLAELTGKDVAGGPLYELSFLERIAFAGKVDTKAWRTHPTTRVSRALRHLRRGRYTAVVLTGREFSAFAGPRAPAGKKLEKVATSAYYPPALLVLRRSHSAREETAPGERGAESAQSGGVDGSDEQRSPTVRKGLLSPAQRDAVERAFVGLSSDPEGRALLETMGARSFGKIDHRWLERTEETFDANEKK